MKPIAIIAIVVVAGVIFFMNGGGEMTGLIQPAELPDTIALPDSTFMGDEQSNPFAR